MQVQCMDEGAVPSVLPCTLDSTDDTPQALLLCWAHTSVPPGGQSWVLAANGSSTHAPIRACLARLACLSQHAAACCVCRRGSHAGCSHE